MSTKPDTETPWTREFPEDNLERGVRELRDDLLRLRKIAENALRFRIEQNGTCDHKEYMTALCTQCEIREALTHKEEKS